LRVIGSPEAQRTSTAALIGLSLLAGVAACPFAIFAEARLIRVRYVAIVVVVAIALFPYLVELRGPDGRGPARVRAVS
jgi:hypothetical protein